MVLYLTISWLIIPFSFHPAAEISERLFCLFSWLCLEIEKKKQFTSVLVCILIFCFVFSDVCDCLAILLTAALTYIPTSLSVLVTSVISPRDYKDWSIIPEEYIDLINLNNQARGGGGGCTGEIWTIIFSFT